MERAVEGEEMNSAAAMILGEDLSRMEREELEGCLFSALVGLAYLHESTEQDELNRIRDSRAETERRLNRLARRV